VETGNGMQREGWLKIFMGVDAKSTYSQTCVQRPPSGPQTCGRCLQLVVVQKGTLRSKTKNWDSKMVAVIDSWSLFGAGH